MATITGTLPLTTPNGCCTAFSNAMGRRWWNTVGGSEQLGAAFQSDLSETEKPVSVQRSLKPAEEVMGRPSLFIVVRLPKGSEYCPFLRRSELESGMSNRCSPACI